MAQQGAEHSVQQLEKVLSYQFGYTGFREGQLAAVQATLAGRDCLVVLPTGAGKSLCFQLPPLAKDSGFSVVVSPLIALARDQVSRCQDLDIDAEVMAQAAFALSEQFLQMIKYHQLLRCSYGTVRSLTTSEARF